MGGKTYHLQVSFSWWLLLVGQDAARGANDLVEQEAIADAGGRWIKRSHVHNATSDFKKSHHTRADEKNGKN